MIWSAFAKEEQRGKNIFPLAMFVRKLLAEIPKPRIQRSTLGDLWASFHQPHLPFRRCVDVVRNLLHVDLRTTVARSRGKPLHLEVSELERGILATFINPEILEINAGDKLSKRS